MLNREQNNELQKMKRLSVVDILEKTSNKFLIFNNIDELRKKSEKISTRKISLIEEKYKSETNTSRKKNVLTHEKKIHCLFGKECIYYKKFTKLKKEVQSILNINSKLNLFNKSLYSSLNQKKKDYEYLLKENSILKKAIFKINGLRYNDLINDKLKDFRANSKNIFIKKLKIKNNSNNISTNNDEINNFSSKYLKWNDKETIKKYSNVHTTTNTIYNNEIKKEKEKIYKGDTSESSVNNKSLEDSLYDIRKKNKTFNKIISNTTDPRQNYHNILSKKDIKKLKLRPDSNDRSNKKTIIFPYENKKSDKYFNYENNSNIHYEAIKNFNNRKLRNSSIFTQKYSLLSLDIDLLAIMNNNDNMLKLQKLTYSDEHFLSSIRNSNENQLLKYSDLISCLISDYIDVIKLGMRMKDFMRSSLSLVDSIISNDSSKVLIENTCKILNCDRASLFVLDQISDSLIVYSGEGVKRAQIKVPKDKGVVGACFIEGKKIRIDDAYIDQRFNKDVDIRTNYKTKSILCFPLKDKDDKCFGVIEAINKFDSAFNDDDEEILKLLSHQASTIFKNAFFNDNNKFYFNKLFLLVKYCNLIIHIKNKKEFSEKTEDLLLNLYNCMNSAVFYVEKNKIVRYIKDNEEIKEYENNMGIVGKIFRSKEVMAYENIKKCSEYNSIIDLESPSGLLAIPILTKKTKKVCIVIEVPFAGEVNNLGKPKENEMILIKYLTKCIKNWIFEFELKNESK